MKKFAVLLAALTLFAYFYGLGGHGLIDPDEGRYAEIPREMLESGDYVTPRLNYVKYFEKPVLHYWLTALSFTALGQNEFAARLTPVLCGLGGALAVFWTARKLLGFRAALYASVILATSLLWFAIARLNILDMTVSFFITLSVIGFWYGQDDRRFYLLFYSGMALATLTKGLIGIILPGGIAFWYIVLTRRWRLILRALYWPGAVLFFALTVPWFYTVCGANDDFFYFFFVQEHFLRYATRMHDRYQPFWFFVPILIGGLVPWTGLLPGMAAGLKNRGEDRAPDIFLALWFAIPFLFFSMSSSKLIPYILPSLPPLAILGGRALERAAEGDGAGRFVHLNGALLSLLAVAGVVYPPLDEKIGAAALYPYTLPVSASLAAMALAGWFLYFRRSYQKMAAVLCVLAFVNALTLSRGFVLEAERNSYKESAAVIQEGGLRPQDAVVAYGDLAQGLGFYLKRRIVLAEAMGELEFGAKQGDNSRWFIGSEELKTLWDGDARVFLVADKGREAALAEKLGKYNFLEVGRTRDNVILSNQWGKRRPYQVDF